MTMKNARIASISAENDEWLRRAIAASIARAKDLVAPQGPIRSATQLGRLSDSEWGWIVATVVWGWVASRAEQAATEGLDPERGVRVTKLDPEPWDTGAIRAILPELAKSCASFDWSKPANAWSKDELAEFLSTAFALIQRANVARDAIEEQVAGKPTNADVTARQMNGAIGNPRMTVAEFNDGADY
jgi:hypothetical protein